MCRAGDRRGPNLGFIDEVKRPLLFWVSADVYIYLIITNTKPVFFLFSDVPEPMLEKGGVFRLICTDDEPLLFLGAS